MKGLEMDLSSRSISKSIAEHIENIQEEIKEVLERLQLDKLEEKNKELLKKLTISKRLSRIGDEKNSTLNNPTIPGDPSIK